VIVRAWNGYSIIAVGKGVTQNGAEISWISPLKNKDELGFAGTRFKFNVGRPEAGP
jgi:hypothetical protein